MSREEGQNGLNRRGFLRGLATAGGAAAASGLVVESANANSVVVPSAPAAGDSGQESKGYRITPHVLEYYEKARF